MDTWIWVILGAVVVIGVIGGVISAKKQKAMMNDGKIVRRAYGFQEKAEEFTLRSVTRDEVLQGIKEFGLKSMGIKATYNESPFEFFFETNWKARLKEKSTDENQSVYTFEFLSWKTSGSLSVPEGQLVMNQLLTAVEKMFLKLDPETQVKTYPIKLKTKRSFF